MEEEKKGIADDWFYSQRAYPDGLINKQGYFEAIMDKNTSVQNRTSLNWSFEGPLNTGGRLTDVEMPHDDQQTIYVGAASGGIFKSTDQGESWSAIFDEALSLSIGDIEIYQEDSDIIYVGTGESNAGGSSLAYDGYGVYKSTDAGDSWTQIGLENVGSIGKVAVHPTNQDIVYVAAMGDLFGKNEERGVYKSINGGQDWEQVLFVSDSTGFVDLAINPNNPDIIYAAGWERIRRVDFRQYGGETSGVYRSTDGGETWEELSNGLPVQAAQKGRIGIGISASNPDILYLHYAQVNGYLAGVFKTVNGGDDWFEVSSDGIENVPYMWWFGRIEVDPVDPDKVYFVGFSNSKSTDGGNSWDATFPGVHVDQHSIFVHPQNTDLVLSGNDGGLYISYDGGDQYIKRDNLPITQMYTINFDPSNPERIYSGTQDNGTNRTVTGNLDDWTRIYGGDGFHCLIDPNNSNIIYASSQNGNLVKSTNGGLNFLGSTNGISFNDRKNWKTPVVFDPANSSTLYYGSDKVYRSTNQAGFWTAISSDLSNGSGNGNLTYGTITTIDVSALDSDVIYAGTDDGNVWATTNGGDTWIYLSDDLPERWVTKVLASSEVEGRVYVSFSGYRFNAYEGHIYQSDDYGLTWTNISENLADIPVNDLIETDGLTGLLAASDVGVHEYDESTGTWTLLGDGLPNVVVSEMAYVSGEALLYAGTYGRSAFSLDLSSLTSTNKSGAKEIGIKVYPTIIEDYLTVETDADFDRNRAIFSLVTTEGRQIFYGSANDLEGFDLSGIASGTIVLTVFSSENQAVWTKQLIVL